MKSILQEEKQCFVCGKSEPLHLHHVFFGNANRRQSDKYGCVVWLCPEHHVGKTGVHFNKNLDLMIKKLCQAEFEKRYSRSEFVAVFGRNWL